MADNPYEAPSANLSGNETFAAHTGGVSQGVVEQLRRTKGWTRLISVMCFILGGLMLLGAIFGGTLLSNTDRSVRGLGGLVGVIMFIYGVMGVLQIIFGTKLGGFSSAVQRLMYSARESDLEAAQLLGFRRRAGSHRPDHRHPRHLHRVFQVPLRIWIVPTSPTHRVPAQAKCPAGSRRKSSTSCSVRKARCASSP
jgi:hypothetical protein